MWTKEDDRLSKRKYYLRVKDTPTFKEKVRAARKRRYEKESADPTQYAKILKDNLKYYYEKVRPSREKMEVRRDRTREIQQRRRTKQQEVRKRLQAIIGSKCCRCGIDDFRLLDFDHIDPHTKTMNISQQLHRSFDELELEVRKCQLLCANCHRLKTLEQREFDSRIRAFRNPKSKPSFR